ncbi:acyl-CoA carboxylase subunit epsilon [Amycolatopsis sp. NBC_01488]|uniref:acyl-CoA carboxylase subunit epsilon n=1 Tax=Amycolatopsis sp. NBC_01488 TaxID=2903563 RepID=UPI002E2869EB|nr:acyl-CoA carboxylase subunit epsilon [Amycolatopsis sp. NBC_01488]
MEELVLVVRGRPDDAELAALVAVLLRCASSPGPGGPSRSAWAGEPWRPAAGGWRRSGLPR